MASVNPLTREIQIKIVYYGPGLGGKTTTLEYIHQTTDPAQRGKMVSLATPVERTLYFDFLPIKLPEIGGYTLKLQLFTVPGQVHFNSTRKLVLSNADGVVFVADSQHSRADANLESFDNLILNLDEYKINSLNFPIIFQYNKRDLENIMSIEELNANLNISKRPALGTCAVTGNNVYESLELVTKEVLRDLKNRDILARQDSPKNDIDFLKEESGITHQMQEYSQRIEDTKMSSDSVVPYESKNESINEKQKKQVSISSSLPPDRPTIPAPIALSESTSHKKTKHTLPVPSKTTSSIKNQTNEIDSLLSFVSLWPSQAQQEAISIENSIKEKKLNNAIQLILEEIEKIITLHSKGLPNTSEDQIISLLGLDGRQYLRISSLAISPNENISQEDVLSAYLFLLQAIQKN